MGWVVNVTPRPLYPRERPGICCIVGWVGLRAGLDRCGKFRPPPVFDPRTVQRVASRYTDWAIPASCHKSISLNHVCISELVICRTLKPQFHIKIYTYFITAQRKLLFLQYLHFKILLSYLTRLISYSAHLRHKIVRNAQMPGLNLNILSGKFIAVQEMLLLL